MKSVLVTVFVILVCIGGCIGSCNFISNFEYAKGERIGVINKFSYKGLLWKTYEAEMVLEGLTAGQTTAANLWHFSIDNSLPDMEKEIFIDNLSYAIKNNTKMRVEYRQIFFPLPWRGQTGSFVTKIELQDNPEAGN